MAPVSSLFLMFLISSFNLYGAVQLLRGFALQVRAASSGWKIARARGSMRATHETLGSQAKNPGIARSARPP